MILVVSTASDQHAAAVLAGLAARAAPAELVDLSEFPRAGALAIRYDGSSTAAELRLAAGRPIDLRSCTVIWWRRPQPFMLDDQVRRGSHRTFAYNECLEAFAGMWQTLEPLWINHPTRDEVAARKAYQLRVAQGVGLRIPRTLITNDGAAARAFSDSLSGGCIYKAFSATVHEWRETRLLGEREREQFDAVQCSREPRSGRTWSSLHPCPAANVGRDAQATRHVAPLSGDATHAVTAMIHRDPGTAGATPSARARGRGSTPPSA